MTLPRLSTPAAVRSLAVRAYLRRLALDNKPIVIGPWRSELGFEVLYWLPFLTWAFKRYGIAPERCIALSRGGMGKLYPAAHAVDLYRLRTVDEVRLENQVDYESRGLLKQTTITPWDLAIAAEAVAQVRGSRQRFHLLHPAWMYWLFEPAWNEQVSLQFVARHTEFAPLPVPTLPEAMKLPKAFVCVRFYERHTFPLHDQVQGITRELVQGLAAQFPIVLLNQPTCFDDHADLPLAGPNIYTLPHMDPCENLLLQAAVLARCQAFVGTYGGVAQWALRYRKPSLSLYTQFTGTAHCHRNLSQMLAAATNTPFEVADMRAIKLWKAALGPVTIPDIPEHSTATAPEGVAV